MQSVSLPANVVSIEPRRLRRTARENAEIEGRLLHARLLKEAVAELHRTGALR